MKRARPPSTRKDAAAAEGAHAARRPFMELIHPLQPHSRRHHDHRASRSSKRARHSEPPAPLRPPLLAAHCTLNFIYAPNRFLDVDKLLKARSERTVSVHVPSDHCTSANSPVRARCLWGTDAYTDDSDLVAVLLHTGYITLEIKPCFDYITVNLKLQRHIPRSSPPFTSTERYGMCSRPWGSAYNGARVSIVSVQAVEADRKYLITPCEPEFCTTPLPGVVLTPRLPISKREKSATRKCETSICFDMLNKPCQTYSINDVSSLIDDWRNPFHRLQREVLYVENSIHRFEICRVVNRQKVVRFGRVKNAALVQEMLAELGVRDKPQCPMRNADLTNVHELAWKDIDWDIHGVTVKGVWYPLTKISFQNIRE